MLEAKTEGTEKKKKNVTVGRTCLGRNGGWQRLPSVMIQMSPFPRLAQFSWCG